MPTSQQIITGSYSDLGGRRPGQGMSPDVLNECQTQINTLIESWALQRDFIFEFIAAAWVILPSFSDLTTNHVLAKGNELALRKNLAMRIAPSLKIILKIPEPLFAEIAAEAAAALAAIQGIAPS